MADKGPLYPVGKSTAELEAEANATIAADTKAALEGPPEEAPAKGLPAWLTGLLGLLAAGAVMGGTMLPAPWGLLVQVAGWVLGYVVGAAQPTPTWADGKPVVQGPFQAVLAGAVPVLAAAGSGLSGWFQVAVHALALVCAALAGVAAPQLGKKTG
jgi:hypothetical protein